jgi:hypothetical protein
MMAVLHELKGAEQALVGFVEGKTTYTEKRLAGSGPEKLAAAGTPKSHSNEWLFSFALSAVLQEK